MTKNQNQNKSDLGVNFIAPDGGWGWLVVIAAALSTWVTYFVTVMFGGSLQQISESNRISISQITTILIIQQIAASCTGLLNGEIFRRFTFRQISLTGAIFTFFGQTLAAFEGESYLWISSIMCGIGKSLIFSASYIAVYTYFKKNLRTAVTCMCLIDFLATMLFPTLIKFLTWKLDVTSVLLFNACLSLHNFPCALVYQPVKWHSEKKRDIGLVEIQPLNVVFGSRHIAKLSALEENSITSSTDDFSNLRHLSMNSAVAYPLRVPKNSFASFEPLSRSIPKIILPDATEYLESPQDIHNHQESPQAKEIKKLTILQRISVFLDLDLLADFSYLNIVLGLTLINSLEHNFTYILILNDLYYDVNHTAIALSVMDLCEFLMTISIPMVTRSFRCSNKVILLFAIIGLCFGRTILFVLSEHVTILIICFGWMGLCRAIQNVFSMLILPSYIPLNRLPAALGFQQAVTGIFVLSAELFTNAGYCSSVLPWMNVIYVLFVVLAWLGKDFLKRKRNYTIPPSE